MLKAYHFHEDFVRNGVPIWWDENDDVNFEAERRTSRSAAAVRRAEEQDTKGDKPAPPGRYYVPVPKTRGGAPFPTFKQWQEQQAEKQGRNR